MSWAVPLPVALPLLAAAVALVAANHVQVQRLVTTAALAASLTTSTLLMVDIERSGTTPVAHLGGWPAPIGITYVADRLATLLLVVTGLTLLIVLVFSIGQRDADETAAVFHPAYLVLAAGVNAAFLAGDLFHLFVAFEVLLMASFVLLTLDGTRPQVRFGISYVVLNTIESLLLLAAVGLVYAATGTLNIAELHGELAGLDPSLRTGLQLLLLIAFGMKAAVFPLFFWLPDSYPAAPSAVTAIFAALLTKVGVYALIRTQTVLFPDEHRTLLTVVAVATILVGVAGAIAQDDITRILSFHIVSQIGYMVLGLAVGGVAAIAATVYFLVHQIPVKSSLFLVDGLIHRARRTSKLGELGGLARSSALLGVLFLLPALSLAGLPPFSGFIAKLGLVEAAVADHRGELVAVALVGSLLTLVSMTKIWVGAFWGQPPDERIAAPTGVAGWSATAATCALVAVGLAVAVFAGPLYTFCEQTAVELTNPTVYVEGVLP